MLIYPLALVAALLFRALTDISVVYLAPLVTRFHIPLLTVTPSTIHSFASLSLPFGAPSPLRTPSTPVHYDWQDYGSCVELDCSLSTLPEYSQSTPAVVASLPSALGTLVPLTQASRARLPPPPHHAPPAIWSGYLVDFLVVCGYLAALYWMSLGFAILACIAFHRVASAVDVQRMDSPWSFYSPGLLAETSCVCRPISCAPDLLVPNSSRVHRIARTIRPVPPALVAPTTAPVSEKVETPHRGSRGGKRQHRRRHAQDIRQTQLEVGVPPAPLLPSTSGISTAETRPLRPHLWDAPVDSQSPESTFISDGRGRIVSIADARKAPFVGARRLLATPAKRAQPATRASTRTVTPPPSVVPQAAPVEAVRGRTYSHRGTPPPTRPAITISRRMPSLESNLANVTIHTLPTGKLNQRARRALMSRPTLHEFLDTP
ncbi:hypothetical protein BV20DRAFT_1119460 [Pilatotrama ljubarskyi]|nr:hypothetical protein BV20DRAFT_1119460 [Pilatotrama ljubarskyi]